MLIIKNQNVSFTEFYLLLNQIKNTAMYLLVVWFDKIKFS